MTDVSDKHKWIAVDLDKTLAYYESGDYDKYGALYIGPPLSMMVQKVKLWLLEGKTVKVFTARVAPPHDTPLDLVVNAIQNWTEKHIGVRLPVTCVKDRNCEIIYDDRAMQILANRGITKAEEMNAFMQYSDDVMAGKVDIFGNPLQKDEE